MKLSAPAKINLMLHVTGKRADGYHTLDSLMARTDLADEITVKPADAFALSVDGPFAAHAPVNEHNLVSRAVRLMEEKAARCAPYHITLIKNIPAGAGLGGGSADAAAVMQGLNQVWGDIFTDAQLSALGLQLGAELPVCLADGAQWVRGIGDVLMPVTLPHYHVVLIWPGVTSCTADVFAQYKGPYSAEQSWPFDIRHARNDLTDAAITLNPVIAQALGAMPDAIFTRMTGSGSCVFGVFDTADSAHKTAAKLAAVYPTWWVHACKII